MVPCRTVELDKTTCSLQEWQLCLPYFCCYLPLLYLTLIMHWFSVRYVSRSLFGIFWWYLVVTKNRTRRHVTYKNDNFGIFLLLELSPLLVFEFDFLSLLCNTNTLRDILMMLFYKCTTGRDDVLRTRMTTSAGLWDICCFLFVCFFYIFFVFVFFVLFCFCFLFVFFFVFLFFVCLFVCFFVVVFFVCLFFVFGVFFCLIYLIPHLCRIS